MDIAKYVGLFLLKNEYCFLPGIGSLQIEKSPSVYDKETQKMSAPVYEVKYRQVGGSIDDSFANFIANNERISIAHAANHLKDFCAHAKSDMREGRAVEIPGIGKFSGGPNDSIHFVTDPHLHIEGKAIPFFKNSTAVNQKKEEAISNIIERTNIREPKADEEIEYQAPSVNWGKVFIFIAIIAVLIGGGILLYWYVNKDKGEQKSTPEQTEQPTTEPVPQSAAVTSTVQDTVTQTPAQAAPTDGSLTYKVALHQYATREKAESRVAKLKSYGNTVELYAKDSANYYVVMSVTSPVADTSHVIDSLRKQFNPGGKVEIVR
jgi:nucleoid DNA-binding protein/flagellar basal body-associated protein FliL